MENRMYGWSLMLAGLCWILQAPAHAAEASSDPTKAVQHESGGFASASDSTLRPDKRIIALDFNKTNVPPAPSQALFRVVNGSQLAGGNGATIHKPVGPYGVTITKGNASGFEFHGANGDASRVIPGGPTSLSFLVADFLGSRDGTIRISLSNLTAGTYLFRSYHLDPFVSSGFGYAQGTNASTATTIQARVHSRLLGEVQATTLGSSGLGTTFIRDSDIPTLSFPFAVDDTGSATIELSTRHEIESERYIFLNGFEIWSTIP